MTVFSSNEGRDKERRGREEGDIQVGSNRKS